MINREIAARARCIITRKGESPRVRGETKERVTRERNRRGFLLSAYQTSERPQQRACGQKAADMRWASSLPSCGLYWRICGCVCVYVMVSFFFSGLFNCVWMWEEEVLARRVE